MKYHFSKEIAKDVGVECAVLYSNIQFRCLKNKSNNKNYIEGNYWTYQTSKGFSEIFEFWNEKKVQRLLRKLEDRGYIKSGEFNKSKYDRTKWYCCISNKGDIEWTKMTAPEDKTVQAIPYITKDNNKYIEENPLFCNKEEELVSFVNNWNSIKRIGNHKGLKNCRKITNDIRKEWNKVVKKYTKPEITLGVKNYIEDIKQRKTDSDFASHRFSVYEFLKQENGLTRFINK